MRENRDFVVPVNIFTPFAHAPFSWAARHIPCVLIIMSKLTAQTVAYKIILVQKRYVVKINKIRKHYKNLCKIKQKPKVAVRRSNSR